MYAISYYVKTKRALKPLIVLNLSPKLKGLTPSLEPAGERTFRAGVLGISQVFEKSRRMPETDCRWQGHI